ncbi:hypothetical protein OH797_21280 [Streptomyces anulatus]|uniref:hypothetical protein n=1 Tax=Streptomyces TaxID=1883 RepID=UPI00067CF8C7|nr:MULTISPECIES: hypothetical protein [Streptomyces]KND38066.1 hypothetical protein IQ60_00860 [Streptomyces europaeiscabiei]MDF9804742.1 hypothetical protein [Streptomyces sp. HB372]KPL33321.1 hypothetical protein JI76_16155 [Streptomyces anulatus]KQX41135.1 hypothetical protein ASD29_37610 [Streptomyces sp. Root1295]KRA47325.1 hypothetical protein ASD97_36580 [Streptomyces sp. Root63]
MSEQTVVPGATGTPAMPEAPPPVNVFAPPVLPPEAPDASPKPPRRVLRAVARWTAAALAFGVLGTGTAFGIASLERTDVPGLATEDDGRWDYPELSLPALPAGSPRPFGAGNPAEIHHADLRDLLLPAPAGAVPDKKLPGGWISTETFLDAYRQQDRQSVAQLLKDAPARHIAARGWTMPDGTVSRIYLVRFTSTAFASGMIDDLNVGSSAGTPLDRTDTTEIDASWSSQNDFENTSSFVFAEQAPFGAEHVRQAYTLAGDTIALVVHERSGKRETDRVPFQQTLILQNQLLA